MVEMTTLQFDILTTLASDRRHGYALVEEIGKMSNRKPGVATVYAALSKLERAGLVEPAGDEVVGGRVRRYFAITQSGRRALTTQAKQMASRSQVAIRSLGLAEAIA
jgi:PadR family transcriptional regulator PadR